MTNILVTGSCGQLGTELVSKLVETKGHDRVIASDIRPATRVIEGSRFIQLDVLDPDHIRQIVEEHKIGQIYHLAAILSARAEEKPLSSWDINMKSLLYILELCREKGISLFWPSSIAVFGPGSPRNRTPQDTVMDPNTVYGISKLAGERWCHYYHKKYGVDVRSLRYPGIVSYRTLPGGGTTDYAVDIFHYAVKGKPYTSFLSEATELPMMYIDDAIRATVELMDAPAAKISVRSSYNLAGISFTPSSLLQAIKSRIPDFTVKFEPDFRQAIADSWPGSIDDSKAREDWNWEHEYDLGRMVDTMLEGLVHQQSPV